jgi:hypothetical protein
LDHARPAKARTDRRYLVKITTTLTLDVDPNLWNQEFHTGTSRDEIRSDVVQYLTTMMQSVFGDHGSSGLATAITSVSVTSKGKESKRPAGGHGDQAPAEE